VNIVNVFQQSSTFYILAHNMNTVAHNSSLIFTHTIRLTKT